MEGLTMRNRKRAVAVGAVVAMLAGGSTAAAAASSTDSGHPRTEASTHAKTAGDAALAARLGVSTQRLDQALRAAKPALVHATTKPTVDRFVAAIAANLGLPKARVAQVLTAKGVVVKDGRNQRLDQHALAR